jgi:hypothetical protein
MRALFSAEIKRYLLSPTVICYTRQKHFFILPLAGNNPAATVYGGRNLAAVS